MAKQQHASQSAHNVSAVPAAKLLQTRPFQNEHESDNQQSSQVDAPSQSVTGGWDLTQKILSATNPSTPSSTPAVGLPLQAKLTIGEPNDKYEQEADRVAHDVVQRINAPDTASPQDTDNETLKAHSPQQVQRQIALPSMTSGFNLTTKWLSHSSPPPSTLGQPLQAKLTPRESLIQRETQEEDDELQMKPLLQRKSVSSGEASSELESSINRARSGGQPLDTNLQQSMGQAMGADFSGVKVHTDSTADSLNHSIQAKAFTTGQDVFFRSGEYSPGTKNGQELIAHELTHVVQQNGSIMRQLQKININSQRKVNDQISRKIEIDEQHYELSAVKEELKKRYGYTLEAFPALNEILTSLDNRFYSEWEYLKDEIESLKVNRHLSAMEDAGGRGLQWRGPMESMIKGGLRQWLKSDDAKEPTQLNCFQTVLYTAVKAGIVNKTYLKKALEATGDHEANPGKVINLVRAVIANKAGRIEGWKHQKSESVKSLYQDIKNANIPAGHVILFGDAGEHVALSTGGIATPRNSSKFEELGLVFAGHEMIENNNGNANEMGTTTDVRKTTVEDELDMYLGTTNAITWGPLPAGKQLASLL